MRNRALIALSTLILTAFLSLLLGVAMVRHERSFYSLIISNGQGNRVKTQLQEGPFGEVYSADKPVVYSDFTTLREIPLAEISHRLLDSDKRFDPYLKELKELYLTPRGERIVFQSNRSLLSIFLLLRPIRDSITWEQVDHPYFLFLAPLIYTLFSAFVVFRYRKKSVWVLLVQVLWLPSLIITRGSATLFLPLILYWEICLLENWGDIKGMTPYLLVLISAGFVMAGQGDRFFFFSELVVSLGGGFYFKKYFYPFEEVRSKIKTPSRKLKNTEHALFEPTYFNKRIGEKSHFGWGEKRVFPLPVLLMALPLFLPLSGSGASSVELPSLRDMYNHLYYQENILFSPQWGETEPLTISSYQLNSTGEIIESRVKKAELTEEWRALRANRYSQGYASSLLLSLPKGQKTLYVKFKTDFDKYGLFAIIILFFMSKLVLPYWRNPGKQKKSLQIIKRGREVA
jgi:hypothetical protein